MTKQCAEFVENRLLFLALSDERGKKFSSNTHLKLNCESNKAFLTKSEYSGTESVTNNYVISHKTVKK